MRELGFEYVFRAETLSKTRSATIDVAEIPDKKDFKQYLEMSGWNVTEEKGTIWKVSKTIEC